MSGVDSTSIRHRRRAVDAGVVTLARVPEVVVAPAKLTRSLRITGVRADGHHLIDAEMVSLDLADTLTFSDGDGLEVRGAPPTCPRTTTTSCGGPSAGRPDRHVVLDKRIPSGAGLGGGSADAAAVLRWAGAPTSTWPPPSAPTCPSAWSAAALA